MQLSRYRFQPKLIPTVVTILLVPTFAYLGTWQSDKAQQKKVLLAIYDAREAESSTWLKPDLVNGEEYRYKKIKVRGHFDVTRQILLDNRVHDSEAGYHVVTPLKIEDSEIYVLVNRGWVPVGDDRAVAPVLNAPEDLQEIEGVATLPPSKFYTLDKDDPASEKWPTVWQNLDFELYKKKSRLQLQPIIVQMSKNSIGSYVYDWSRPDLRVNTNLGYAFQWYGMAVLLVIFFIGVNVKKVKNE